MGVLKRTAALGGGFGLQYYNLDGDEYFSVPIFYQTRFFPSTHLYIDKKVGFTIATDFNNLVPTLYLSPCVGYVDKNFDIGLQFQLGPLFTAGIKAGYTF